jgi:mannose-6-phosphate isomerase-like protein (cupin superfamily)
MKIADFFQIEDLEKQRHGSGKRYFEFLRVPAMSAGVYILPPGGKDPQSPHKEDELYYVVRGKASMQVASEARSVSAGSVIFVAAAVEHHFFDVKEELVVLVFFAPAETS